MNGVNGIQMSMHPKFHRIFKDIKKKCEMRNGRDISDKRFSLLIARMFEQNVGNSMTILENAEVKDNGE